ncbi:MAG: STAS domain-containing protein [Planctomycetaceae bacterium]|jgi:anti-anti-sigma factor|nr:STAS domain-containing protein [Planctomycetaceae bacterium]MCE2815421.1 STAS domain-containing protein [Planctomycetaceae bacterium]
MEIKSQHVGDHFILSLDGRFDASWSEYVGSAIETAIQRGEHHIEIDLGNVHYMSSAGIGVLLKYRKRLAGVGGSLRVINPVDDVLSVLRLMKLEELLLGERSSKSGLGVASSTAVTERKLELNGVQFESYHLEQKHPLRCEWFGYPDRLTSGTLDPEDAFKLSLSEDRVVIGLGSLGQELQAQASQDGSLCRFGESLAVSGIGIEQPTDGSRVPDFQISRGDMIPDLQLLYGISMRGDFAHLIRFEAGRSQRGSFPLSGFIQGLLDAFECKQGAFALVVEAATVVGASLIQSPTRADGKSPWMFPAIRNWISFTSEQNEDRMLALIVGIACKDSDEELRPFVRPLKEGGSVQGHFHAAVFPYRPLAKGLLPLHQTIHDLFKHDTPKSVLHLLSDDRPIEGVGQTELMRGACWFGSIVDCGEMV